MGLLQNGQWVDQWYNTEESNGEYIRKDSQFRHWITPDGAPGPTGKGGFAAEKGRYHLYVSLACPWAHRTLIFRQLKQLDTYIDVTVVDPIMLENGWAFSSSHRQMAFLYELYLQADPTYEGRVTVPVLWDNHTQSIVNNESADIIRIFNHGFNHLTQNEDDYYPEPLRQEIDTLNHRIYHHINNGVYRAGFATTQAAYQHAFNEVFDCLDWVEARLSQQRYLTGEHLTEADWRLFTTLIRFDAVYYGHFKTNRRLLMSYPAISGFVRELYQRPGISQTIDFQQIKRHYYISHRTINPTGIVPEGPEYDYSQPHGRERFTAAG